MVTADELPAAFDDFVAGEGKAVSASADAVAGFVVGRYSRVFSVRRRRRDRRDPRQR